MIPAVALAVARALRQTWASDHIGSNHGMEDAEGKNDAIAGSHPNAAKNQGNPYNIRACAWEPRM
jgi:hypothetical protein